jgi:hypothetical protein
MSFLPSSKHHNIFTSKSKLLLRSVKKFFAFGPKAYSPAFAENIPIN